MVDRKKREKMPELLAFSFFLPFPHLGPCLLDGASNIEGESYCLVASKKCPL
jgi:hypothetical protein